MINKKINRLYTAFLIIGITITSIGLYTTIKTLDNSNKVDTIGTITSIVSTSNDTPVVYVTYNVDGKRYTSVMSGYSSTFYEGKKIDIYYMKNDPNIIGNKKLELLILLFPFIGLIFLLIGGINIFKIISNKKKKERLIKTGTVIEATYIETNTNFNLRVLGRNPYPQYEHPVRYLKIRLPFLYPDRLESDLLLQFPYFPAIDLKSVFLMGSFHFLLHS